MFVGQIDDAGVARKKLLSSEKAEPFRTSLRHSREDNLNWSYEKLKAYTLGYEGLTLPAYISTLKSSGVGVVLDVREKAWSRKPGFSKTAFQQALSEAGIEYVHVSSAGNPSKNRKTAKSTAECLRRYGKLLKANPACLDELVTHIKRAAKMGRPACMTCYEHLPVDCHRSVLIEALLPLAPKLKFTHLPLSKAI